MDEASNRRLGELIQELAQGNCLALEEIALLIERILRVIGNAYYRNKADVEDEIHNLYIRLYENARYFKKNKNACAWVVKIFENSIKSHLRKRKNEDKFLNEEILSFKTSSSIVDEKYVENYLFLREIFDVLSEEERKLVIYYHWCKCSIREVAQILHKSKSGVSKQLHRLEKKIKNI